jgi:undecaprenyl-diphosphatase
VQGITEFLPISSTAHVLLLSKITNFHALQFSELTATNIIQGIIIISYFLGHIINLIHGMIDTLISIIKKDQKRSSRSILFRFFFCAIVPVMIIGLCLRVFNIHIPNSVLIIAVNSIIFGILLAVIDLLAPSTSNDNFSVTRGVFIGIMQVLAFIPGVSRLGICIIATRAVGINREKSVRVSFICGAPMLLFAGSAGLLTVYKSVNLSLSLLTLTFVTFVVGFISLHLFLMYIKNHSLLVFAIYRVLLGALLLILF